MRWVGKSGSAFEFVEAVYADHLDVSLFFNFSDTLLGCVAGDDMREERVAEIVF